MVDTKYKLKFAVWEITFACNMRCKHCGSGCGDPKPDELTTEEALNLCDQLIDIGMKHITFSGGEPFIRNDWPLLAKKLGDGGVLVNAISNGWFIDEKIINSAFESGLSNIAVSLDGCEKEHDGIRIKGSYRRVIEALDLMRKMDMPSLVCTCLNSNNIKTLPQLKQILLDHGVERWQLQLTEPMGNAIDHPELIIKPTDLTYVIDFAHEVMENEKILINLADNIGYFDTKSTEINMYCSDEPISNGIWRGCQAGKMCIGIRCNGDITPCLSIRDDDFIEGNIRHSTLREIWTRSGAFAWNRDMTQENLTGFCRECQFGDECLGGCTTMKRTMSNTLYENKFCFYRTEYMEECKIIEDLSELDELISKGQELMESGQLEAADKCLIKAAKLYPNSAEALNMLDRLKKELEGEEIET